MHDEGRPDGSVAQVAVADGGVSRRNNVWLSASAHNQRRPPIDNHPVIEHDTAAAVWREDNRLLATQQSGQHGAPPVLQVTAQIGR